MRHERVPYRHIAQTRRQIGNVKTLHPLTASASPRTPAKAAKPKMVPVIMRVAGDFFLQSRLAAAAPVSAAAATATAVPMGLSFISPPSVPA